MLMQKNRIWVVVAALAGAVALSVSCQEKEIINPPSLTAFSFKAADNAVLSEDYVATVTGTVQHRSSDERRVGDEGRSRRAPDR